MNRFLKWLGDAIYRLGWVPGDVVAPGEAILGQKLAELNAELRVVNLEKKAVEDELAILKRDVDMLNEIVERERARVKAESEYYANWLRLEKPR